MATLSFEQLEFHDQEDKIFVKFLKSYHFILPKEELQRAGLTNIGRHQLTFSTSEKSARTKFNKFLSSGFRNLISMNGRPTTYVHQHAGIPLIGTNVFGIIDRDTNVIELKPLTGCNLNCTFCSVDEGAKSKKTRDFLVEKDYLVKVFNDIAALKHYPLEAHIAGQNEPTLYPELLDLIADLRENPKVRHIAIDTNGMLLTKASIAALEKAGLTRIDLSMHSLDPHLAKTLAGAAYDIKHIMQAAKDIRKSNIQLLLAPVYLPGVNDQEIEKIILLSKELDCIIGIQNFFAYDSGRRPAKEIPMAAFEKKLIAWEGRYHVDLHLADAFDFRKDKVLKKPFQKGDLVPAHILGEGKYPKDVLCCAQERVITFSSPRHWKEGEPVKLHITRDKHNIFLGRI